MAIPRPPADVHLPFEHAPRPVAVLAADYPHGACIPRHRHRRAQLLHAIQGVMVIEAAAGRWVVPPSRALWLDAGQDHAVRMSGDVRMRTVFIEPGTAAHLPAGTCVVEVPPLLRELIVAAADLPLQQAGSARDALLVQLLLAELSAIERLPLYLPWPADARLRTLCDAIMAGPDDAHAVAGWAARLHLSARTLQRLFVRETGMTFGRWRQHARLFLALEQLAHGHKIVGVALEHGYRSQSAFAAMFKRHFGVPPSDFYR